MWQAHPLTLGHGVVADVAVLALALLVAFIVFGVSTRTVKRRRRARRPKPRR